MPSIEKLKLNRRDSFVPEGSFGPVSKYNSEGKENTLKNLPMETYTVDRWWKWRKSNGQTFSGFVYHDRQRYQRELDRKSTRLNSSHVAISYAVFCLKKKKKKTDGR